MITTNIGAISLTNNQILNYVPEGIWERFSYIGGEVIGVTETQPTQADIDALKAQLAALPDITPQSVYISQFSFNTFWGQVFATLQPQAYYALAQFARSIELLWNYPNLPGITPFLQGLVGQTYNSYTILQADADAVIAAFTAQGVVLP